MTLDRKETFTVQDEEDFEKRVLQNPGKTLFVEDFFRRRVFFYTVIFPTCIFPDLKFTFWENTITIVKDVFNHV